MLASPYEYTGILVAVSNSRFQGDVDLIPGRSFVSDFGHFKKYPFVMVFFCGRERESKTTR